MGDYSAHILTIDNDLESKFFTTRWDGGPAFEDTIEEYVGASWLGIEFSNGQWTYTETDSFDKSPFTLIGGRMSPGRTMAGTFGSAI